MFDCYPTPPDEGTVLEIRSRSGGLGWPGPLEIFKDFNNVERRSVASRFINGLDVLSFGMFFLF